MPRKQRTQTLADIEKIVNFHEVKKPKMPASQRRVLERMLECRKACLETAKAELESVTTAFNELYEEIIDLECMLGASD